MAFGDAAFASSEDAKSQFGEIVLATSPENIEKVQQGRYECAVLLSFRSATIKRVVRSTLSSEGYAISEAAELTEWTRQVIAEIRSPPGTSLRTIERSAEQIPAAVYTDSNNLYDTVGKDAGAVNDRRLWPC